MQQQVRTVYQEQGTVPITDDNSHKANYQSNASNVLGGIQISVGVLTIAFNIAGAATNAPQSHIYHGIWCGIFFIITGIVGVLAASSRNNTGLIVGFMTLSVLSAILSFILLIISAFGIKSERYCYFFYCVFTHLPQIKTHNALNGMLVALALIEAIIAISSSAICCAAACCGPTNRRTVTTHYATQPQVMVITGVQQPGIQPQGIQPQAVQQPGVHQPGVQQPGVQQPGIQQPGVHLPGIQPQAVQQPGTQQQWPGGMQMYGQPPSYTPPVYSYGPGPSAGASVPMDQAPQAPFKQQMY